MTLNQNFLSRNEYVPIIFRLSLLPGSDFDSLELFSQLSFILQLRVLKTFAWIYLREAQ